MANKLHIPVTEYMNWENGNTVCGIQQLKVLADMFHVSLDAMADNAKDIVIAADNLGDSVNIPFLNGASQSMTQQMDVADNMMPVSSVLPADTQEQTMKVNTLNGDATSGTKEMGKVSDAETKKPAEKPSSSRVSNKAAQDKKKKKMMILIGSICAAAIAIVVILILVLNSGNSSVSLGAINRIAEGDKYTLFIDNKGSLKTYGTFDDASSFKNVVQVSAYGSHAVGLTNKGTVVTNNGDSEVSDWKNITMIAAGKEHTVGLKKDGTVVCSGDSNACEVSDWSNIKAVYAGNGVTIGLKSDGTLAAAGSSSSAVINQSGVSSVSMSDDFVSITKKDGTVTSFAIGSKAVISTSSFSGVSSTAIGTTGILGLKSDGTVAVSSSDTDLTSAVGEWKNIKYIAAYGKTYVAADASGKIYGTGDNTYNQYEATATASASASTAKLDSPKNIKTDLTTGNLSIKWDSVENASYYKVSVTGLDEIKAASNSTSIPTTSLENGKEYTISIVACSDKPETHPDSDAATTTYTYKTLSVKLDAPSNVTGYAYTNEGTSEFIIDWAAVANADFYTVSIQGGPDQTFTTNEAVISLDHTNITESTTTINVQVTAGSNSTAYTASDTTKVALGYKVEKKSVTISYKTEDGKTAGTAQTLLLPYGKYKASSYLPKDLPAGLVLENTAESFEVTSSTETFSFKVITNPGV
jgi:alpha-tubulin suppressor-like RCC1 family protein